jgi:WD40 repeat protein
MSDAHSNVELPSVAERTRPISAGASIVSAHFLGDVPVFVLGDQELLFLDPSGERRVKAHDAGILSADATKDGLVTGGDDGKVMLTRATGEIEAVANDPKGRWIDRVVAGPDNAVAWSAGKGVFVRNAKGEVRSFEVPSTAGGLTFAPKGFRLAVAHYNGVTLWFPNAAQSVREFLEWKGSHVGVTFSPDGKFLVTTMQEAALHGWRLADRRHMRMSGYSGRVRSMDWSARGDWLATGGAEQLILWPFQSKDGPMGKDPKMLAPWSVRVGVVACHPKDDVVAAGYANGMVMLVRIGDGAEIIARRPGKAPVTALGWRADGMQLAIGTEDGEGGVLSF